MSTTALSRDDFAKIASSLVLPSQAFVNGEFSASASGDVFETVNPADRSVLGTIASCGAIDLG